MTLFPVTLKTTAPQTAVSGWSVVRRFGLGEMRNEKASPASVVGPGGMPVSSSVREAGRDAPIPARPMPAPPGRCAERVSGGAS